MSFEDRSQTPGETLPGAADTRKSPSVSFIIPTLRRPLFLKSCLKAILAQTTSATEVLAGIREDDETNDGVFADVNGDVPIRKIRAEGRGVVGSMNSCLAVAKSEFIALLDDDVEIPPHWLKTQLTHLQSHPDLAGASGRDILLDDPEMRRLEATTLDVGRFHWYGRISGNHHCGAGPPRCVDILRGSNCLFDGEFLRRAGFDDRLRGNGAQVNWELGLALQARKRGRRFLYDSTLQVPHHVAPRHDADQLHRRGFDAQALEDMIYNEALMLGIHGPGHLQIATNAWNILVGGGLTVGLLKAVQLFLRRDPYLGKRITACARGRWAALSEANRIRRLDSNPSTATPSPTKSRTNPLNR